MQNRTAKVTFEMNVTWTKEDFNDPSENAIERLDALRVRVTRADWFEYLIDFAPDARWEPDTHSAVRLKSVEWSSGTE